MIMMKLLDVLYLNGYRSLWDKYHDRSGLTSAEHLLCVDKYREVMTSMFKACQFRRCGQLRKAYRDNDWGTIYEMILEWTEAEEIE